MALNTIHVSFNGQNETITKKRYQYDKGQVCVFDDIELPEAYKVIFSNNLTGENSIPMIGGENGVGVPDDFFLTGLTIYGWIYLSEGNDDGQTVKHFTIPIEKRVRETDEEPTPEEQTEIEQLIVALNGAVTTAETAAENAGESAEQAETAASHYPIIEDGYWYVWDVDEEDYVSTGIKALGEDGTSPTVTVTAITGGHRVTITDVDGDHVFEVMDGTDGNGIQSITKTGTASNVDTYTILYTNGQTTTFTVTNGITPTVDDALSPTSTNPVQNKVIDKEVGDLKADINQSQADILAEKNRAESEESRIEALFTAPTQEAVDNWLDAHPEATTTVQDGAITVPKFSDLTRNAIVIQETTEKAYFHNVVPYKADFYPNLYTQNIPIKYAKTDNLFIYSYLTGIVNGVTRTKDERFLKLAGTAEGNVTLSTMEGYTQNLAKLAGKSVNVCVYFNKQSAWYSNGNLYLIANGGTTIVNQRLKPDGVSFSGWKIFENIQIPETLTNLAFKLSSITGSEFENGDFFWAGIFETIPEETEIVVTDEPVGIVINNATKIDTMMHESIVAAIIPTKTYVDDHVPDILGFWSDNVYAIPEQFGAVGDGVTDDATALASCISYSKTSGKPVRGFGKYKTSGTIELDARYLDVYLKEIVYTGNQTAVKLSEREITFRFHTIQSSGVGITFDHNSGATIATQNAQIFGNAINSTNHCLELKDKVLYCTCDIRKLASSNGDCIHRTSEGIASFAGEFVFRSSTCGCPNGYVSYNVHSSKFYDFTIEANCKYGFLNPLACACYGMRHREQTDGMKLRIINQDTSHNNGPLIKFTSSLSDGNYGFKYISYDSIPWFSVDMSNQGYDGSLTIDEWQTLAYNGIDMGTPIRYASQSPRFPMGTKLYFIGNHKVLVPEGRVTSIIDVATLHLDLFDSSVEEDIVSAASLSNYMGTDFLLDIAHTDIYLNASYGAVGYNELTLTQNNGNTATIYDKLGNVIFDGTNTGNGKWSLKCIMDRASMGRYDGGQSQYGYWCYDGTNEKWEITKIE